MILLKFKKNRAWNHDVPRLHRIPCSNLNCLHLGQQPTAPQSKRPGVFSSRLSRSSKQCLGQSMV